MANYANLPSMQLELLDGNLQAVQQLEGPVVLIVDTAKKGPNASQYVVTDPNKAVQVFGADSPIIESLSKVRFGGAKNVIFYRIGGESAFIKNLISDGALIETTEKSVSEGSKYFIYFGQPSLSSKDGVSGDVKQDDRYLIIKDEKNRIVYSNMVGATIDDSRFTIDGFDPATINKLDHICKLRIGHVDSMPAMENVLAQPVTSNGVNVTEKNYFSQDVVKYTHPGSLFAVEEVQVAIPAAKTSGAKQLVSLEVAKGAPVSTKTYAGNLTIAIDGTTHEVLTFDGTESISKLTGIIAASLGKYQSSTAFDVSASGDEITLTAKQPQANRVLTFTPQAAVAGQKEVQTLTVSGAPTANGTLLVKVQDPVSKQDFSLSVPVVAATDTTADLVATKIKAAIEADTAGVMTVLASVTVATNKLTVTYRDEALLTEDQKISVDSQAVTGLTVKGTSVKGKDPVKALNITVNQFPIVAGAAPSGISEIADASSTIPAIDLTTTIKAVTGHPLVASNKLFYSKGEYRPTRVALVYVGNVSGSTYAQEVADYNVKQAKDARTARQEWVYDIPYTSVYSSVDFDPIFSGSEVSVKYTSGAGDFTATGWSIGLTPKLFQAVKVRDGNGKPTTGTKAVTNAELANYKLFVEYDYLVDQVAAVAAHDPTPAVGQAHGPAVSMALVATGDKDTAASYKSGADNIGSSWEKMYEVLDSALDDLETTQATAIYLGSVTFDAPNITDMNKDKWELVKKSDNVLRFVRKIQNEDGSIRYEWNNFPKMYRDKLDTTKTTHLASSAQLDSAGNPIVAAKYHEVNFAHRLGMFCHNIVEDEGFILGTIGTSSPRSASTYDVNKWIGVAPTKDSAGAIIANGTGLLGNKYMSSQIAEVSSAGTQLKDARPKGFFYTDSGYPDGQVLVDSNGAPIDIGKYMSIVPAVVNMPNFSGFGSSPRTTSGAAIYCALLQNVEAGNSTTNTLVPGVTLPFVIKKNKLDDMANAGYVTFVTKPAGVTVTSGEVPTSDASDYQYISTTIIVGDIARKLRARINPFLGKGLNDVTLAAMNTATESVFQEAVESGAIRKYDFNIVQMATVKGVGRVAIPSTIVPAFELRKVDSSIKLAYDI